MTEKTYTITESQLNTLSYALEQVGFLSMDLEKASEAIANYRETEPSILDSMHIVFAYALSSQAKQLEELATIIENVHHAVTGYKVEQARKELLEGLDNE